MVHKCHVDLFVYSALRIDGSQTNFTIIMVGNFRRYKFFAKQAKIWVSELFVVLIFTVGELGPVG